MDCGDSAPLGVDEENRNAVGGLNGEEKAGRFCEGGVAFAGFVGGSRERPDDGGMNLF